MDDLTRLAALTAGWCVLHSALIARGLTTRLRARLGGGFRAYRLFYNLLSLGTLLVVVVAAREASGPVVFGWSGWWAVPRIAMLGVAGWLFVAGARAYDLGDFLGVRGLFRGEPRTGSAIAGTLHTAGILQRTRHPWYAAALLAIWARPLDRSALVVNAIFSGYLIVGTVLEEQKLVAEFGGAYEAYQRAVPMLFPRWRRRRP